MRNQMAAATIELGAFAFPAHAEKEVAVPQTADLCIKAERRGTR
jgi:hypothetical protein